jgi:hypothetical protein
MIRRALAVMANREFADHAAGYSYDIYIDNRRTADATLW